MKNSTYITEVVICKFRRPGVGNSRVLEYPTLRIKTSKFVLLSPSILNSVKSKNNSKNFKTNPATSD